MPAGRPRAFDVDDAVAGALDLFWQRGYRATTTRDLEARLGVAQSSLYHAFGSKSQLLGRALDRYVELLDRELLRPLAEDPEGIAALDRFFVRLGAWHAEGGRGCLIGRLLCEAPAPGPAAPRLAAYRVRLRAALAAALRRAADLGEIPGEGVDRRADLLVGAVLGLNLAHQSGLGETHTALVEAVRAELGAWRRAT
jgi:TetR/AcrR family transcriptional repressor of nem operon